MQTNRNHHCNKDQNCLAVDKKLIYNCSKNNFRIKLLETEKDKYLAYQLRKEIFCDELNWVSCANKKIEVDDYDKKSYIFGVIDGYDDIIGTVRVIHASESMMIEKEFLLLLSPEYRIRKETDTAEASRLCVRSSIDSMKKTKISHALYYATYKWCLLHEIRYLYIVVEKKMYRNLNRIGFSCHCVGPTVIMPDGTHCIAAIIDWKEFDQTTCFGMDGLLHKIKVISGNAVTQRLIADRNESIYDCSAS